MLAADDLLATRFVRGTGRVIEASEVAVSAFDALEVGAMLSLPHQEVARMEQARAADRDGWIDRMRQAVAAIEGPEPSPVS
jgi:hypothetical protein